MSQLSRVPNQNDITLGVSVYLFANFSTNWNLYILFVMMINGNKMYIATNFVCSLLSELSKSNTSGVCYQGQESRLISVSVPCVYILRVSVNQSGSNHSLFLATGYT